MTPQLTPFWFFAAVPLSEEGLTFRSLSEEELSSEDAKASLALFKKEGFLFAEEEKKGVSSLAGVSSCKRLKVYLTNDSFVVVSLERVFFSHAFFSAVGAFRHRDAANFLAACRHVSQTCSFLLSVFLGEPLCVHRRKLCDLSKRSQCSKQG